MSEMPTPIYLPRDRGEISKPFAGDLFGREAIASKLEGLINRVPQGIVVAIDSPWGGGKTWFGRNLDARLRANGHATVYIDAFKRDYVDDPFVMITSELASLLSKDNKALAQRIRDGARKAGAAILPLASKVALAAAGRIVLGSATALEEVREEAEKAIDDASKLAEKAIEERIKRYESEKASVDGFKELLAKELSTLDRPIVVFIDELDRCKPNFAVQLIERVKHFFEVPKLVFVLLLNRTQLEQSVCGVYGPGIDGHLYLSKFIQIYLSLPTTRVDSQNPNNFNISFCHNLLEQYGLARSDGDAAFAKQLGLMATVMGFSYREIERSVILYSLGQPIRNSASFAAWPIALKVFRPSVFGGLLAGNVAANQQAYSLASEILSAYPNTNLFEFWRDFHHWKISGGKAPTPEVVRVGIQSIGGNWHSADAFFVWLFGKFDLIAEN